MKWKQVGKINKRFFVVAVFAQLISIIFLTLLLWLASEASQIESSLFVALIISRVNYVGILIVGFIDIIKRLPGILSRAFLMYVFNTLKFLIDDLLEGTDKIIRDGESITVWHSKPQMNAFDLDSQFLIISMTFLAVAAYSLVLFICDKWFAKK